LDKLKAFLNRREIHVEEISQCVVPQTQPEVYEEITSPKTIENRVF